MSRVELDAVEAGAPRALRSLSEATNQMRNVLFGHLVKGNLSRSAPQQAHEALQLLWRELASEIAGLGLGDGRHPHRASRHDVPNRDLSRVLQLDGSLRAVSVHAARQLPQAGQEDVVRDRHLVGVAGTCGPADRRDSHGDHSDAAAGALFVVAEDPLAQLPVRLAQVRAHGRHDDPVAKREAPYPAR